ncbi:Cytochrome c oxidase subunit 4, mitochondrial [Zancudomyces culisetae]|uniref:Cytochrome c oxidase subunit 4, mitochondrial n=1 Tax=Zancudomyces culisetae TaxID=1213189 RepID=A0A1R1PS58_ZANCU|nr:Cytochrome c oxidase subunit 4, mitochondrial [Zancudomyces culisetae]|eukprot:OMH83815.1 Cytochrome c oxidase subunit 4, mitochondrial [Zancudomyces culisetae]
MNVTKRVINLKNLSGLRSAVATSLRPFSAAAVMKSDDHKIDIQVGKGAPPERFGTDEEQATGMARLERLAALEGKSPFDMEPLQLMKKGTKTEPTVVASGAPWRLIGCQGPPGEDHELIWIKVERDHPYDRCPECGNVYKLSE